jgi:hypothetical protein
MHRGRLRHLGFALVGAFSLASTTPLEADAAPIRAASRAVSAATRAGLVRVAQAGAKPKASSTPQLIARSQDLFDDQQYEESIQTLSGALVRPGIAAPDKSEIFKLLAFNYITLGRAEEADAAVRALLVHDEAYRLPKSESPRFREFFEKTRTAWEGEGKPGLGDGGAAAKGQAPIALKHAPVPQVAPGEAVKVEGSVEDPEARVQRCELFYRSGSSGKFVQKSLAFSMGSFRGQIPGSVAQPPLVEYFVLALDKDGLPVASRGDTEAPLRVAVPEEETIFVSPWFWVPVGAAVAGGIVLTAVLASQSATSDATVKVNVRE